MGTSNTNTCKLGTLTQSECQAFGKKARDDNYFTENKAEDPKGCFTYVQWAGTVRFELTIWNTHLTGAANPKATPICKTDRTIFCL